MPHSPLAQHATRWRVDVCVCVCTVCACVSEWRLHWRGGLVSDRKANWQAQTHRSGESMGPARAYLLPMMKPNTMNTSMMVPATATTAMMMTGFCSLETIAADEMDTHTKEKLKHFEWTSAHQTTICRTFGNWAHWVAWRLITCPTPHPFPNLWESGRGTFLFLSCPYTHGSTVSESGLNSPRRRQRCPSSQTKTHSGWIVSHAQLSLCSDSLHWQTGECNRKKRILVHFRSSGSALCKYWEMQYQEKSGSYKKICHVPFVQSKINISNHLFGEEFYCHITHLQVFLWKLWFTVSVKDIITTMPRLQTSNLDTGHTRHVVMSN